MAIIAFNFGLRQINSICYFQNYIYMCWRIYKNENNIMMMVICRLFPHLPFWRIFMSLFEFVYMHSNVQYVCLFILISTIILCKLGIVMMAINSEHVYNVMEIIPRTLMESWFMRHGKCAFYSKASIIHHLMRQ